MEVNSPLKHKDLVEKSKLGNRSSQYKLYELYVDAMYSTSKRILGTKEDAEDIIQDSFIEAFKNLDSFKYESTFGAWLKRIVINKSINHLKIKKIPLTVIDNHQHYLTDENQEVTTNTLDVKKIKIGIKKLPFGYKQIINLYLLEGYNHKEIAEVLKISVSTSKSQYHRAKKKLIEIVNTL